MATFFKVMNKSTIYKLFKANFFNFGNHKKRTTKTVVLSHIPLPRILK